MTSTYTCTADLLFTLIWDKKRAQRYHLQTECCCEAFKTAAIQTLSIRTLCW